MPGILPLNSSPLSTFHGIDDDVATYCLEHAALTTVKRGDLLIQQGEKATHVYVVRSGYAKMVSMSPDGHEVMVGIVGPRDVLGQAAVLDEGRDYLVTATALTAMDMAIWSRAKAIELSKRFPEIHARLDVQLAQNVKVLLGRVHSVSEDASRSAWRASCWSSPSGTASRGRRASPSFLRSPARTSRRSRAPRSTPPAGCWPTGSTRAC